MYQLNELIALITPYVNLIGGLLTIVVALLSLKPASKQGLHQNLYQQCCIDNCSVNLSNTRTEYNVVNNSIQYDLNGAYTTSQSAGMSDGSFIFIFFLLAGLLWKHIAIFHLIMSLLCLASLSLMIFFAKKNADLGLMSLQKRQVCTYLISFLLCFTGLFLVDQSLSFQLRSLEAMKESLGAFFTICGMIIIPWSVFNPLSKSDKPFCSHQKFACSAKEILSQIAPAVFSFLLCSGVVYHAVIFISKHYFEI